MVLVLSTGVQVQVCCQMRVVRGMIACVPRSATTPKSDELLREARARPRLSAFGVAACMACHCCATSCGGGARGQSLQPNQRAAPARLVLGRNACDGVSGWRHQRTTPRVSLHATGASLATAPSTCSIATVTRGMTRLHDLARFQVARHSNPTLSIGVPWCLVARKLGKPMSLCPCLVSVSAGAS